jgi:Flp pilus assembly protein TadD
LRNDFVVWDDDKNFLENPSYRGLSWSQIRWDWTSLHVGVYQPLSWMVLGAQYLLFGLKPWGYHLTSLILYAINTVVLFVLTVALLERCRRGPERVEPRVLALAAALAVALFAVHPLRTEVVAWASCQPYLPCALFLMLAVLAYLRACATGPAPLSGWLLSSFAFFIAALLSKAVAVTLPVVLLILDVYPLGRMGGGPGRWFGPAARRVWWEKVPFAVASLCFMGLAIAGRVRTRHLVSIQSAGLSARISQSCYGVWFYLVKTIWPASLTAFYPLPQRVVWCQAPFLFSILGTLGVSVVLFLVRRRWPGLLAVWLSYLVILAPNLGLVRIGAQIAADRYSYIAMLGGVVVLAAGLCRLVDAAPAPRQGLAALGLTAVGLVSLAGLVLLTHAQCRVWHTTGTLWTHVLNHGGGDADVAHNNLGVFLNEQGRVEEARVQFQEAARCNPSSVEAHTHLGFMLNRLGRIDEARAQFEEALRINPASVEAHNNLGVILDNQGRLGEAGAQFKEALRHDPRHPTARDNLRTILLRQGRTEEARAHLEETLRYNANDAGAHDQLGSLLFEVGKVQEASDHFAEALRIDPKNADAHCNLGIVLLRQGKLKEARDEFDEALRLKPNHAGAHNHLGLVLSRQGRIAEAMEQWTLALRIDPNKAEVDNNRAMVWAAAGEAKYRDGRRAVAAATHACELTGWKNASFLDTLAAASAEAGDFDSAVKWQSAAIDLLTDERRKQSFRSRLQLYQARQPYREPVPAR